MDHIKRILRRNRFSSNTEKIYLDWIYRFLIFHNRKPTDELQEEDIKAFLDYLSEKRRLSAATHNQALNALKFYFHKVLKKPMGQVQQKQHKTRRKKPVILSRDEVRQLLSYLHGDLYLMAAMMYGSGLGLSECLNLRLRDIDFNRNEIIVRKQTGGIQRRTILPQSLVAALKRQLIKAGFIFEENLFYQKNAEVNKLRSVTHDRNLSPDPELQFLFPARSGGPDLFSNKPLQHHIHESHLQKAVKAAAQKAGINKKASCISLRHSFAVHLLEEGYDIRSIQKLLGHKNLRTTMFYASLLRKSSIAVKSPLDEITGHEIPGSPS